MDISQMRAAQVQGAQGEHHQRMTIGDRISQMKSAIDDAVTSGMLSDDQAIQMRKALDDITKILSHNEHKQNGSNNRAGSATQQLSANDREKIHSDLQELGKQVSAALNSQGAARVAPAPTRGAQVDDLFKAIDTNGDGKIRKDELTSYLNRTADDRQSGRTPFNTYGSQGSLTINVSITTVRLSITT